jgi:hypothetical protein
MAGHNLVRLYPEAWRNRYRSEVLALIDDDPPRVRGLTSLLLGAVDAHVRPQSDWSAQPSALVRMRLSIGGMFTCWMMLSVMGFAFQKETEEASFAAAALHHPVLAISHDAVLVGAALGALAIAVGGLPLAWQAARQARAERDKQLSVLIALPAAAIGCFAALTFLLVAVAPAGDDHPSVPLALAILAPWWFGGLACVATCVLAPRMALARATVSSRSMRRASLATVPLAAAMCLVTGGLVAYAVSLAALAPVLSAQSGGPVWPSTGAVLAVAAAVAAASTGLALVSSRRALGARAERTR